MPSLVYKWLRGLHAMPHITGFHVLSRFALFSNGTKHKTFRISSLSATLHLNYRRDSNDVLRKTYIVQYHIYNQNTSAISTPYSKHSQKCTTFWTSLRSSKMCLLLFFLQMKENFKFFIVVFEQIFCIQTSKLEFHSIFCWHT